MKSRYYDLDDVRSVLGEPLPAGCRSSDTWIFRDNKNDKKLASIQYYSENLGFTIQGTDQCYIDRFVAWLDKQIADLKKKKAEVKESFESVTLESCTQLPKIAMFSDPKGK